MPPTRPDRAPRSPDRRRVADPAATAGDATTAGTGTGFLALGDSYTIGEAIDPGARWVAVLAHALRDDGIAIDPPRLIATTGWTSAELDAAIDAAEPPPGGDHALVTLLVGVNDQYRGLGAAGFRTRFAALLRRAAGFAGGDPARVLVLAIPDWGVTPFARASGRDTAAIAAELDAFNAIVAAEASAAGAAFVDIAPVSRARGGEPGMLATDGLHPSALLHAEWAALALPAARRILAGDAAATAPGHGRPMPTEHATARDTAATAPFDAATAKRIARAFLPPGIFANRYDYYYTLTKLRTDPLYPGVLSALDGCDAPLLDLGCGLGLLAHALHDQGRRLRYLGVDIDADKIGRAPTIAARAGITDARFAVVDLAEGWPAHRGSVAILDVLQYLDADRQRALIDDVIAMLVPGSRLVIRSGLADDSGRSRTSRITDRLAHLAGWMQETPKTWPTAAGLRAQLEGAGLRVSIAPLYGRTPFNNWIVVGSH